MSRYIDADAYIEKYECCGYLDEISVEKFNEITPTSDVQEVVRGEWIKITDVDIRLMGRQIKEVHYKCSVCGGESYFDTNYCPHCGARMGGER